MTETTNERAARLDRLFARVAVRLRQRVRKGQTTARFAETEDGKLVSDLSDALATEMNRPLTSCGGPRLADERALRFVERYGWPMEAESLDWLSATAREAGDAFNAAALERRSSDDAVPF